MTPKEYLSKCRTLEHRVQELQAEYESIKITVLAATKYSSEPTRAGVGNPTETTTVRLLERSNKINKAIDELANYKLMVSAELDLMTDDTLRRVLRDRYIVCKSFEQIAVDMHYSIRRIYQLHGQALLEFEALYPEHFI